MLTEVRNKNKYKTPIDWDLNVFCPEQWYGGESFWDHDLWKINARIYMEDHPETNYIDTDYNITLLTKEAEAIGLKGFADDGVDQDLDGWLDQSLDGFISLEYFKSIYWDLCSDRVKEYLDDLPRYLEDVPERMMY